MYSIHSISTSNNASLKFWDKADHFVLGIIIIGSGSDFVNNFGSGSSFSQYCHLKLFCNSSTILIELEISFSLS